jgi:hypothetical protein
MEGDDDGMGELMDRRDQNFVLLDCLKLGLPEHEPAASAPETQGNKPHLLSFRPVRQRMALAVSEIARCRPSALLPINRQSTRPQPKVRDAR